MPRSAEEELRQELERINDQRRMEIERQDQIHQRMIIERQEQIHQLMTEARDGDYESPVNLSWNNLFTNSSTNIGTRIHNLAQSLNASGERVESAAETIVVTPTPAMIGAEKTLTAKRIERIRAEAQRKNSTLTASVASLYPRHATELVAQLYDSRKGEAVVLARLTTYLEVAAARYDQWQEIRQAIFAVWDEVRAARFPTTYREEVGQRHEDEERQRRRDRTEAAIIQCAAHVEAVDLPGSPVIVRDLRNTYGHPITLTVYSTYRSHMWYGFMVVTAVARGEVSNEVQSFSRTTSREEVIREAIRPFAETTLRWQEGGRNSIDYLDDDSGDDLPDYDSEEDEG